MPLWNAVCEVHDKFNLAALEDIYRQHPEREIYLIAHPESTLPILQKADFVGSTSQMLNWIKNYSGDVKKSLILIATETHILYNMGLARPDLQILQAPIYKGCQCNACPYMGYNTVQAVIDAQNGISGVEINYLTDELIQKSLVPLEKMIEFSMKYYK
jgi:quinolinate synthase